MKMRIIAFVALVALGIWAAVCLNNAFKGGVGNPLDKALGGQQQQQPKK
ncbi:MAG: hypothetical protein K2X93_26305 [Candidatus Obscuribacterales bacterium]|nr:hypothetical protein [Candidatus Obscuribacterales bacterium]